MEADDRSKRLVMGITSGAARDLRDNCILRLKFDQGTWIATLELRWAGVTVAMTPMTVQGEQRCRITQGLIELHHLKFRRGT